MKRIQMYVDESKDSEVYALINDLENESDKRGYVQDQLKERLRVFKLLNNKLQLSDPADVLSVFGKDKDDEIVRAFNLIAEKVGAEEPLEVVMKVTEALVKADQSKGITIADNNILKSVAIPSEEKRKKNQKLTNIANNLD